MTDGSRLVDPRFLDIRCMLAQAPTPGAMDTDAARIEAAVSLVLRSGRDLEVLLIKRSRSERDPWSGHVALPGGRRDEGDDSLLATAMRETVEETGVDLASGRALLLGRLQDVRPSSPRLPALTIAPFAFGVPGRTLAHPSSREVADLFWVPLHQLNDPAARCTITLRLGGTEREFPALLVRAEKVWGLTYRILTRFLELTKGLPGP